jgi:CRP-like cAMP-binding protein
MVESLVVPAGAVVATAGHTLRWVVFVADGVLVADNGHVAPVRSGDVFGAAEAVLHDVSPATLRAAQPTSVVLMERRHFVAALSMYPAFATAVLRVVATEARAAAGPASATRRRRRFEPRGLGWRPTRSAAPAFGE